MHWKFGLSYDLNEWGEKMKNNVTILFKKIEDKIFIRFLKIIVFSFGIITSILISKSFIYNIVAGLFLVFLLVLNFIMIVKKKINLKKFKKDIYNNQEEFEKELDNIIFVNYKEYILTPNYIVDLNWFKFIKYSDIKFLYTRLLISHDISLALKLITDKDRMALTIWSCSSLESFYKDLEGLIKIKNPNVIKCKKGDIKTYK